ncbi:MAG: GDSL-type esterase/lipase family protein [Oscillospiraceae bacterium]
MSKTIRKFICAASAGLLLALCACASSVPASSREPAATPSQLVEAGTDLLSPTPQPTPAPTPAATPVPSPDSPTEPPAETDPPDTVFTPQPEEDGTRLEAREPVDDSYFAGSAFFGNSLVNGLDLYGGLSCGDFYAATSASVVSVSMTRNSTLSDGSAATLLQALCEKEHDRIYILLGVNEIAFDTEYFISLYSAMLDTIRAEQPEAEIYIMSLTPVTEERDENDELFNMERVTAYNDALYRLAQEKGLYYLDLVEALADDSGYLAGETSTDGIHMTPEKYTQWADYLRTHYAGDAETVAPESQESPESQEAPETVEPQENAEATESAETPEAPEE